MSRFEKPEGNEQNNVVLSAEAGERTYSPERAFGDVEKRSQVTARVPDAYYDENQELRDHDTDELLTSKKAKAINGLLLNTAGAIITAIPIFVIGSAMIAGTASVGMVASMVVLTVAFGYFAFRASLKHGMNLSTTWYQLR